MAEIQINANEKRREGEKIAESVVKKLAENSLFWSDEEKRRCYDRWAEVRMILDPAVSNDPPPVK